MLQGTFIMWEKIEQALVEFHNDVLVILDCFDAGYLSNRGHAHAFEYLAACGDKSKTKVPGPESFTSALIWALKELKHNVPFTIQKLKDKIKAYPKLPDEQQPLVFNRPDHHTAGLICIAPLEGGVSPRQHRSSNPGSFTREEECFFVDLRLFFTKNLSANDGRHVAKMVSPAVKDKTLPLNAAHISVLGQGKINASRNLWSKLRHSVAFLQRLNKRPSEYNEELEDDHAVSSMRKRRKTRSVEGALRICSNTIDGKASPQPITPVSDDPKSDMDS